MYGRVLFVRIGWMKFYTGAVDEKPIGGGRYTKDQIGSELFNFKDVDGFLYGFVKAGSRDKAFNFKRIDPKAGDTGNLEHVTVIFIATDPRGGGQKVVGWYKDAIVYRKWEDHPIQPTYKKRVAFCLKAGSAEARLVPTRYRTEELPGGKGGMGQSNVRYAVTQGRVALKSWMTRILRYVEQYNGPNLVEDRMAEADDPDSVVSVIETSGGFETNPKIRQTIQRHSVRAASKYFEKLGYAVQLRGKPYDLLCLKSGSRKYVEVKGTRTDGSVVALTRNEVDFLRENAGSAAMFVLHSVKLRPGKQPKAFGGKMKLIEPWDTTCGELKPISFFFRFR